MNNHEIMKELKKRIDKAGEKERKLNSSLDGSHTFSEWYKIGISEGYHNALIDIYNFLGSNLNLD